jgi:hypothetical protein
MNASLTPFVAHEVRRLGHEGNRGTVTADRRPVTVAIALGKPWGKADPLKETPDSRSPNEHVVVTIRIPRHEFVAAGLERHDVAVIADRRQRIGRRGRDVHALYADPACRNPPRRSSGT